MLQLRGKIAVLKDGLTQIQFDIQNIYLYIETLSTSTINPTLISLPALQYIFDIKHQLRSYPQLDLSAIIESNI